MKVYDGPIVSGQTWQEIFDNVEQPEQYSKIALHLLEVRAMQGRAAFASEVRNMLLGDHPLVHGEGAELALFSTICVGIEDTLSRTARMVTEEIMKDDITTILQMLAKKGEEGDLPK